MVLEKCAICVLQAANKGKPLIKPIKVFCCLHHLVIDLMDFRSLADGEYKWIIQLKCPFSRYVWLKASVDKSAPSVCEILEEWFGQYIGVAIMVLNSKLLLLN